MAQAILGPIGDLIERVLTHIFLFIDTFVYWLVNLAYQTFLAISQIRIFSNQDLNDLSQRIYIIIGVVAVFLVWYMPPNSPLKVPKLFVVYLMPFGCADSVFMISSSLSANVMGAAFSFDLA